MLNTYIKNQGISKTIIHNNHHSHTNEINWDADYDGNMANITIDTDTDGKSKHFDIKLDNNDLANILNVESINMPIDKRLKIDFYKPQYDNEVYFIELPKNVRENMIEESPKMSIQELIDRRISSPKSDEVFLPLAIDKKTFNRYTLTPRKRHRRRKTHVTHKLVKRTKSKSSRKSSRSRSRRKSLATL